MSENILKVYPGVSAAATTKNYFGKFDSSGDIAVGDTNGEIVHGVITETVSGADEAVGLKVGIVDVIAAGSVTIGDEVSSTALGKAQTASAGQYVVGYALSTGSSGQPMRVLVPGLAKHSEADYMKVGTIEVTGFTSTGVKAAWQNPEGAKIIINKVVFDVTTAATGANTADIGTTAVSAATSSDTLIDGLDCNAATIVADNITNKGSNGLPSRTLASGKWVTYDSKSGDATGLVGKIYIYYSLA